MPRKRREDVIEATSERIKATARDLMAERGTSGLAIREIARALEMTPPALYYYFASLDDLITALIVDAFNAMADALEAARDGGAPSTIAEALFAVCIAYRPWALAHPIEFQLIYGNPIPGYAAPQAITVPAARRSGEVFTGLLCHALQTGECQPPAAYQDIPEATRSHILAYFAEASGASEPTVIDDDRLRAQYLMAVGWSQIHGVVTLEMFHHMQPVVGDMDAYYRRRVRDMMRDLGVRL